MTDFQFMDRYYDLKERYYDLMSNFCEDKAFSLLSDIEVEKFLYWEEYKTGCEEIAHECAEEGYPSHGSNYDLRCEREYQWFVEWYAGFDEVIDDIQWLLQIPDIDEEGFIV